MLVMEPFLVTPVPVDLRLWHREVLLGWKTVAQAQAEIDAEPTSLMARKIQALSLVPSLVYTLITELRTEQYPRIVCFTQHRDVVVCLQDLCREQGVKVVSLYPGTPEKDRTTRLRKFNHTAYHPILAVQVKGACCIGPVAAKEWLYLDGAIYTPIDEDLPGRVRVVKIVLDNALPMQL